MVIAEVCGRSDALLAWQSTEQVALLLREYTFLGCVLLCLDVVHVLSKQTHRSSKENGMMQNTMCLSESPYEVTLDTIFLVMLILLC